MMRKSILTLVAFCLLAASCVQQLEGTLYRPNADDSKEIHFSVASVAKSFPEAEKSGIIELAIVRPGSSGRHELQLAQMGADEGVFSFPETVAIEDGKYSVTVPVLVDLGSCVKGSSYSTCIYIVGRDQATGNYGARNASYSDAVDVSASIDLTWEPLMVTDPATGEQVQQKATYNYNGLWKGSSYGLPVEKAVCEDLIYRLSGWGTNETTLMWLVKEDGSCVLPKQNTGYYNSSYGQYIYVSDYPSNTNGSYSYKSYPCTWDGDRTYSFTTIYYREGSTGNFGHGVETIVFESLEAKVPSVQIEYQGIDSTATGFVGAKLDFSPNEEARSYAVAFFSSVLDKDAIANVADSLAAGAAPAKEADRIETLYGNDTRSWSLSNGPHTIVAVAFDAAGARGETTSKTFTFDPEGLYSVKISKISLVNDPSDENYDPTTTLRFTIAAQGLVKGWYRILKTSQWESYRKTMTDEEILLKGTEMSATVITNILKPSGRVSHYNTLSSGTEYTIGVLMENEYGDRITGFASGKTASRSSDSALDDFRPVTSVEEFLGSYLLNVGVGSSLSSTTDRTFRVDINKMDSNRVIITGLGSSITDFDPMVMAYFDSVRKCLVLDCQNLGKFAGNYIRLAFYTGKAYVYSNNSFLLGWVEDELVWLNDPAASNTFVGYTFMEFSSEDANSNTYLKSVVGSKVFTNPVMTPLERAQK